MMPGYYVKDLTRCTINYSQCHLYVLLLPISFVFSHVGITFYIFAHASTFSRKKNFFGLSYFTIDVSM